MLCHHEFFDLSNLRCIWISLYTMIWLRLRDNLLIFIPQTSDKKHTYPHKRRSNETVIHGTSSFFNCLFLSRCLGAPNNVIMRSLASEVRWGMASLPLYVRRTRRWAWVFMFLSHTNTKQFFFFASILRMIVMMMILDGCGHLNTKNRQTGRKCKQRDCPRKKVAVKQNFMELWSRQAEDVREFVRGMAMRTAAFCSSERLLWLLYESWWKRGEGGEGVRMRKRRRPPN